MKIVFVHLGREHLGIEYISAFLKERGHETFLACDPGLFCSEDNVFHVDILKNIFDRKKKILSTIKKIKPDLVVFSVYTSTYPWACDLALAIKKEMHIKIVFGGIHVTLVPEEVIKNDFVDFAVLGEGEYPLAELVEKLTSGDTAKDIPNIWYKDGENVIRNILRDPITNIDSLPLPDKALFEKYVNYRDDYVILTSRGCVFSCSYCCESYLRKIYGKKYFRRRSVPSVIKELSIMKGKYRFRRVMFFDSVLFSDKDWIREFLPKYKEEIAVPFRCAGHVSFVDRDIIEGMKDAGCYCIDFGVQTFNEKIRNNLLNRQESNSEIDRAFSICDKSRLRYDVDLILGLPSMTEDDYILPLEFMKRHKYFNRLKCYNLAYYPGLELTCKARDLGFLDDEDIVSFKAGDIGDWFHVDKIKDAGVCRLKRDFEKLYKIYPIIPEALMSFIVRKKIYRGFHLIPAPFIVLLQLLIGIKKRDYRFYLYINNYIRQIQRHFSEKK